MPKNIIYVIGRPGEPEELVGDTLYLDCPDSYEGHVRKTFALYRFVRDKLDFDRVFKCDDDTFVNVAALEAAHCPADLFGFVHHERLAPGWRMHKGYRSQGTYRGPWVSGGLGYFLSRRAVSILADFRDAEIIAKEMFEDKAVSDALRVNGIVPAALPGQGGQDGRHTECACYFGRAGCDLLQEAIEGWAFSAHPVGPEAMADAYSRMKASTTQRTLVYHRLGQVGRLGNQLWEIAGTLGLAAYFRAKVSLNADWESRDVFSVPDEFFARRRGVEAWRFPFRLPPRQATAMQDWWYWWAIEPQIRDYFRPRPEVIERLRETCPALFGIPESRRLAVHVRRGDYVGNVRNYIAISPDYYRQAIARFPGMTPVVFSDDPQWCRANFMPWVKNFALAPDAARPDDHLILMSLCRRHIIANSTFSYWAAVLAGSEEVIYPSPWFGPDLSYIHLAWSIPPGWIALPSTH